MRIMKINRFSLLIISVILSGCAGSVVNTTSDQHPSSSPSFPRDDALGSLLSQAWESRLQGKLAEAESSLARAMRIGPAAPEVYYYLALLRQDQGRIEQARQLAGRAMSLGPDKVLQRKLNDFLISTES